MSTRISKVKSQFGITSATVLMTLAVTGNCLTAPIHAASTDNHPVVNQPVEEKETTKYVGRKIIVRDPHMSSPQEYHQEVQFMKKGAQWVPVTSNFLPPFFPVQYENYTPDQAATKPVVVSSDARIPDVTIKYKPLDLKNVSSLNQGYFTVVAEDTAQGDVKVSTTGKVGEWVQFPPAPVGYEYMSDHPDRVLITKFGVRYAHMPVRALNNDRVETKKVTRKVILKLPDGDKVVTQEAQAQRTQYSSANGVYRQQSVWQIDQLPAVDVPKVAGFVASVSEVPAQQLSIDDFNHPISDVVVTYKPVKDTQPSDQPIPIKDDSQVKTESRDEVTSEQKNVDQEQQPTSSGNAQDEGIQTNVVENTSTDIQTDSISSTTTGAETTMPTGVNVNAQTDNAVFSDSGVQTENPTMVDQDGQTELQQQLTNDAGTQTPMTTPVNQDQGTQTTGATDSEIVLTSHPKDNANTAGEQPVIVCPQATKETEQSTSPSTTDKSQDEHPGGAAPQTKIDLLDDHPTTRTQGTVTDDLVNVPNEQVAGGLQEAGSPGKTIPVSSDISASEAHLAEVLNHDQASRHALDQEKLPQTGNQTDNRTTIVGTLLTLLAGFLSGQLIKKYYRRHGK